MMHHDLTGQEEMLRSRVSPGAALLEWYLGGGVSDRPDSTIWRVEKYGRRCLVQLTTWRNGSQTVTILDEGRPARQMVTNIDLGAPPGLSLRELERELQHITTWQYPAA